MKLLISLKPFLTKCFLKEISSCNAILSINETIIQSFKKYCLSVALDGFENAQVSTDGIPNYEMPQRFAEEVFTLLVDDEDEDEDASENDEFHFLTD